MFQKIFSYLNGKAIAGSLERVCKHWHKIIDTDILWNEVYQASKGVLFAMKGGYRTFRNDRVYYLYELYGLKLKDKPMKRDFVQHHVLNSYISSKPVSAKEQITLDYYRGFQQVVHIEFMQALYDIPFFFVLPLKLIHFLVYPLYWYNQFRVEAADVDHLNYNYPLYPLVHQARSLHLDAKSRKTNWTFLHSFTVFTILSTLCWTAVDICAIFVDAYLLIMFGGLGVYFRFWDAREGYTTLTRRERIFMFCTGWLQGLFSVFLLISPILLHVRIPIQELLYPISTCFFS
jgi:hypothetical protein